MTDERVREPEEPTEDVDLPDVRPASQSGSEDDPEFDQEFPVVEDDEEPE